tara:strand:- start:7916 stop:8143 length:228 start_codon:yes stop_codon:yes gene_type:complete
MVNNPTNREVNEGQSLLVNYATATGNTCPAFFTTLKPLLDDFASTLYSHNKDFGAVGIASHCVKINSHSVEPFVE